MPATTTTGPATGDLEYLRALPPPWAVLSGGLSIFAVVVTLSFCLYRIYSWSAQSNEPSAYSNSCPQAANRQARKENAWPRGLEEARHWTDTMDEKEHGFGRLGGAAARQQRVSFQDEDEEQHVASRPLPIDSRWRTGADGVLRNLITRPPPAPPLTPPELSSTVFTLDGRPYSRDSFIHQPNPDYTSPSTTSSGSQSSTVATAPHPRRLSYHKTVPIGVPVSRQSSTSESDLTFSPSSFPPSSSLLPPAPPTSADHMPEAQREIDLHGEIISVLDSQGAGWSRHTRVYGGGVCLACAAAGREHGEGGFYGPNVLPEEMR